MHTQLLKIDSAQPEKEKVAAAAEVIRQGGIVAIPTETVYGLGANALDEYSVGKIFTAKGRPSDNPLIVHIAELEELERLVDEVPLAARELMAAFWPGPLTIIFKKSDIIPAVITAGLDTVAVRMPVHPVARAIIKAAGVPVAAPSANISGKPSPTVASHVEDDMLGKIDMIVDGGAAEVGLESTVIDISGEFPIILRPGGITLEQLKKILPSVEMDPAVSGMLKEHEAPRSPGMKYTHYSPEAEVAVVEGEKEKVVQAIQRMIGDYRKKGKKVGVLAMDDVADRYEADLVLSAGDDSCPETVAAGLFQKLREFDKAGIHIILAHSLSDAGIGLAVRNRLNKAAGYNIIKV